MLNSPSQKKTYNLLRFIVPLLFSVPIYTIGTTVFKQPEIYWMISALLFIIFWIIYYPKQFRKTIKKQTKKLLLEGDNSSFFGKKTMIIDENNLKVISADSTEVISLKSIKFVKVYDDMILIYLSAVTAQIIPTRYLNENSKRYLLKILSIN